jgi:hypothetical protein
MSIIGIPLFILARLCHGQRQNTYQDLAAVCGTPRNPDTDTYFPSVVCCELDQNKRKCQTDGKRILLWGAENTGTRRHI